MRTRTGLMMVLLATRLGAPMPATANPAEINVPVEDILAILRTNLSGATPVDLNTAAVNGVLNRYKGRIELLDPIKEKASLPALLGKGQLFEKEFAYVRIQRVDAGLADSLDKELKRLKPDGRIGGWLVDLRYATGRNYTAALELADRFITHEREQLRIGARTLKSSSKTNALGGPVTILVNAETSGAAEVLASILQRNHVGLVIGNHTAGHAPMYSEFEVSGDLRLRVATGSVGLADGRPFPDDGVQPDIKVRVRGDDERLYYQDAYSQAPLARLRSSNSHSLLRINEADLVRQLRLKNDPEAQVQKTVAKASAPIVRDPVLARAIDLLKGLQIVGKTR